jgi:hypothetical protein
MKRPHIEVVGNILPFVKRLYSRFQDKYDVDDYCIYLSEDDIGFCPTIKHSRFSGWYGNPEEVRNWHLDGASNDGICLIVAYPYNTEIINHELTEEKAKYLYEITNYESINRLQRLAGVFCAEEGDLVKVNLMRHLHRSNPKSTKERLVLRWEI